MPLEADLVYPSVRHYSICLIVQACKGLHAANEKLKDLTTSTAQKPDFWKSEEKLADILEDYAMLLYNIQTQKNTLTDLLMPHVLNPIEDNKEFVDILSHYAITLPGIQLLLATATAETATGFINLRRINSALARLYDTPSAPAVPDVDVIPPTQAPSISFVPVPTTTSLYFVTSSPLVPTTSTTTLTPCPTLQEILSAVEAERPDTPKSTMTVRAAPSTTSSCTTPTHMERGSRYANSRSPRRRRSPSPSIDTRYQRDSPRSPGRRMPCDRVNANRHKVPRRFDSTRPLRASSVRSIISAQDALTSKASRRVPRSLSWKVDASTA
ncbi:hypothetical protein GCK32_001207 [Trichostrongylus colubriformis]|uniref:Uncharacterized protein n=1 Tax=Trichostrongylus colubriformis TaxID=6319 RepID=A0AAN8FBV8_TRICO